MTSNLSIKEKEFRIVAFATIIGTIILSLFFLKDYLTPANDEKYNLPLSIAFFAQTCIAILGLVKRRRSLVFLTFSSYLFLILIYVWILN